MQAYQASDYSIEAKLYTGDIVWIAGIDLTPGILQGYFSKGAKTGSVAAALKDTNGNVTQHLIVPLQAIAYVVYSYSPT